MKPTQIALTASVFFFVIWGYLFLTETIHREFSQKAGNAEIHAVFGGPRYSWIINKGRLIESDGTYIRIGARIPPVWIDNITVMDIPVFYDNMVLGNFQTITNGDMEKPWTSFISQEEETKNAGRKPL